MIKMNLVFLGLFCNVLAGCATGKITSKNAGLTFSNTQKWFSYADRVKARKSYLIELGAEEIGEIGPPPQNESAQTKEEIEELLSLQMKRSKDDIKQIEGEFGFCGWNMFGYKLGTEIKQDKVLINLLFDVSKVGFVLKRKFDRVRPSFLDPRITPGIAVPEHASYPSNHSLESHFLALVLADIYPLLADSFWKSADSIAHNREIAGVHYRSDSKAGADAAKLIYKKLKENSTYKRFIQENRNESLKGFENTEASKQKLVCANLMALYAPK